MEIDSFLKKGTSHPICEDYIRHGLKPSPFVILSDGCSSSQNTDIGARILVSQFYKMAIDSYVGRWTPTKVLKQSMDIVELMGLSVNCLDATLIWANHCKDSLDDPGRIDINMYGDGNIIAVSDEGVVDIWNITYNHNAPYYLNYRRDDKATDQYLQAFPQHNKVENYYRNGNLESAKASSVLESTRYSIPVKGHKAILIASDGIESFTGDIGQDIAEVAKELTAFKNMKGEFITRRVRKAIKALGAHYDDISIGGFSFDSV